MNSKHDISCSLDRPQMLADLQENVFYQSSGRLQDDTMAPRTQLLIQLTQTACWKNSAVVLPLKKICKSKVKRACNWGLPLWPNIQAPRLLNCHFQASQWSRGNCNSFLLLPGICDSPLYTGGEVDYHHLSALFVCSGFLLVLSNLFVVTPESGEEKGSPNLFSRKCEGGSSLFCLWVNEDVI